MPTVCYAPCFVCGSEFGSVRSLFPRFVGCSIISHKSKAIDATAPATDCHVEGSHHIVVCRPCISHKRAVLRRNVLIPSSL